MIVTCERCSTQFQLDDARVPKRGVRVRCSRCKNSFRVVPGGAAAAEQSADGAQRAREDGEEITQDIPEERSGARPERTGSGARGSEARKAQAEAGSDAEAKAGHGAESEESDWEFNNDTAGDLERGRREQNPDDSKPELPEAAPSRGRLADDWFGGGAGDAPLELDDRPQTQAASAPPSAPPPAPPPLRQRPAPAVAARAPLPPAPVREAAPAPLERAVAPALAREPAAPPDAVLELASEPEAPPPREPVPAPRVPVERRAPRDPGDELSSHTWGDLLSAAEESVLPAPRTSSAAGPTTATRLVAWLGRFGHALGSGLTLALFGAGLYAGLAPSEKLAPAPAAVAGLELDALETRFVENATAGMLFVVSGRMRNPGPGAAALGRLALELLDAQGRPLGSTALHAPAPLALLREGSADALAQRPRLSGEVRPGEVRSFEAVVASLPAEAWEFRISESQTAPPAGDLPPQSGPVL